MKPADLSGARILVTGATGFLGQYVMATLQQAGAEGIPLSKSMGYDLRNEGEALQAVLATHPDIIVHLAGIVGGIGANLGQPATFFRDNMMMGMNLIHAAAVGKVKLVTVGTTASYPAEGEIPFREEAFWDGYPEASTASYGIAKKALFAMMQAYRKQFRLHFAYLIPSNLYGPGDAYKGIISSVIPSLVNRMIEARDAGVKEISCWGSGQAIRSFLFAADAAKAIATACAILDENGIVNLPGSEEISVGELATMIAKLVGYSGKILWDRAKPEGRARMVLDGTKAKDLLDWQPETKLADGLKMTVAWYQETQKRG